MQNKKIMNIIAMFSNINIIGWGFVHCWYCVLSRSRLNNVVFDFNLTHDFARNAPLALTYLEATASLMSPTALHTLTALTANSAILDLLLVMAIAILYLLIQIPPQIFPQILPLICHTLIPFSTLIQLIAYLSSQITPGVFKRI